MAGTMTWVGLDVHARSTHARGDRLDDRRADQAAIRAWRRGAGGVAAGAAAARSVRVMRPVRPGSGFIARRARPGSPCR